MGDGQTAYPAHLATDVVLRDGSTVHVRPIRPDDEPRLLAFLRSLSEQSRVLRFFSPTSDTALAQMARQEARVDYARHYGGVATRGADEQIVGHALYAAMSDENAEVAFAVADDHQGRGLGTILLRHLAEVAAAHGIHAFTAFVMHENRRMLAGFRESGFPTDVKFDGGELTVPFPTSLTADALERFDRRDQVAAVNALKQFFAPRGVAVVGASRRRGTIGAPRRSTSRRSKTCCYESA
jgi:ribosomal protein S18 acetylase RimI-like enzyme